MFLQDVKVLYKQLMGSEVDEPEAPIKTSLDEILGDIRSHWEKAIEKNWAETDTYLQDKVHRAQMISDSDNSYHRLTVVCMYVVTKEVGQY